MGMQENHRGTAGADGKIGIDDLDQIRVCSMEKTVIPALDMGEKKHCFFLNRFREEKPYVKIGHAAFLYSEGPDIVREIKKRGTEFFWILKHHDIPNTWEKRQKPWQKLDIRHVQYPCAGGQGNGSGHERVSRDLSGCQKS
jgi:orotidine-5'-phosphate decarboxylase